MPAARISLILLLIALTSVPSETMHGRTVDPELTGQIEVGTFLVAARDMKDPRFRETVILLLEHDASGTMGLIVNRITGITLGEALPDWAQLDGRKHFLFLGGPVQVTGLSYLHGASRRDETERWALDGVSGGADPEGLRRLLEEDMPVGRLRLYLGYAGWAPGQLVSELERDDWHTFRADPEIVFDPDPDQLWSQFISQISQSWI